LREPIWPEAADKKRAGAGFLELVRRQIERAGKTRKAEPGA
jgi:hypothetical protein